MNSLTKVFLCCMSVIGMTALFTSCGEKNGKEEPPVEYLSGTSIFVPNAADTVISVDIEFTDSWEVSNQSTWFAVTPLSGEAGKATLNIAVLDTNPDLTEKVSDFVIRNTVTDVQTQYFVIQDVTPGYSMVTNTQAFSAANESAVFVLEGNRDFEAVPDQDWLTIDAIESDSTTLADKVTYSQYKTYRVSMTAQANDGEVRYCNVVINGEDGIAKDTIVVSQMGELVADYSKTFYRRTMGFRMTATTCGYCPIMSEAMKATYEQTNGRFIPFTIYGVMAGTDWMVYDNWRYWLSTVFESNGFPTGVINGYANLGNYSEAIQTDTYVRLTDEATTKLPSNTLIGGMVSCDGSNINVEISVASKEAGNYTIGVFLMENGIVGSQSGAGANYEHNFVVKDEFTNDPAGDPVSLSANSIKEFSYSMAIPSVVDNIDNCYVCVWIASDDTFSGSIKGPKQENIYYDYGILIDNVVNIPMNGFAVFEYEN